MVIFITGGAGFIGSHLTDVLLKENHRVISLDNFDSYYSPEIKRKNVSAFLNHSNYSLVEGDIRDSNLLISIFDREKVNVIVHLAARPGVIPSLKNPKLYEDVNVNGTLSLLETCKSYNEKCSELKKIIFGSSSSVYGANTSIPFKESDNTDAPISQYGATKKSGELFCYTYHHLYSIPITILRFFTVYGPRQRPDMAIHKFTRMIDNGEEITIYGDGKSKRDYTYISDVIDGILGAVNNDFDFEIFNLGESRTVELLYLISLIEENLGKKAKIKYLPQQPGDVPITFADISKAKKLLNYNPSTPIEIGIKNFVEWYRTIE